MALAQTTATISPFAQAKPSFRTCGYSAAPNAVIRPRMPERQKTNFNPTSGSHHRSREFRLRSVDWTRFGSVSGGKLGTHTEGIGPRGWSTGFSGRDFS